MVSASLCYMPLAASVFGGQISIQDAPHPVPKYILARCMLSLVTDIFEHRAPKFLASSRLSDNDKSGVRYEEYKIARPKAEKVKQWNMLTKAAEFGEVLESSEIIHAGLNHQAEIFSNLDCIKGRITLNLKMDFGVHSFNCTPIFPVVIDTGGRRSRNQGK